MLGQSERGRCVAEPCAASSPSAPRAKGGSGLAAASLPLLPRWEGPGHRPPPGSAAFRSVLESVGKAAVSHAQLQRRAGSAGPRPCGRATVCREQPPTGRRAPLPLLFLPSISSKELTELIERLQKNADQVEKNIVETDSRMQNVSTSHGPTPNGSSKHADPLGGGRRDPKFPPAPQPPCPALQPSSMGGGHRAWHAPHGGLDAAAVPFAIVSPPSPPAQDLHKLKACQLAQYKELTAQKLTESDKLLYVLDGDAAIARHMKHPQGDMITEE